MICGPTHPQFSYRRKARLSGTASWKYVAPTQWILGIRPPDAGLRIEPVLPEGWKGFGATRVFRGVTYHITVERIGPGNKVALAVDGQQIAGNVVPLPPAGQAEVRVMVWLE